MSLIDQETDVTPPTQEQKIEQAKKRIKKMSANIFSMIKDKHKTVWDLIWKNPRGLTPQEVLDSFGSEAVELFTFSLSMQTMLTQADPTYTPLEAPNEYQIQPDGTVIVGEPK